MRHNVFRDIYDSPDYRNAPTKIPSFPFIVDVEVTNHCNLNCVFCGQRDMARPKGFISFEHVSKIADECRMHGAAIRFIRWGEPFLHPNFIDLCVAVKNRGIPLHITTNGTLLKDWKMEKLVEIGLDSLIFSFQGASQSNYEEMRGPHYSRLVDTVHKMVSVRGTADKPFIHISTTVTDESEQEIVSFINRWNAVVDSVGVGKTNLTRVPVPQDLRARETIEHTYRPCTEVYQKLSVDWDGTITACCLDHDNMMALGDISTTSLAYIWNNSRTLKLYRELLGMNKHRSLALCRTCFHPYKEF